MADDKESFVLMHGLNDAGVPYHKQEVHEVHPPFLVLLHQSPYQTWSI
ncbi:MAG TPA: hypothetical protein VIP09_16400 [Dehalococcoidia bacterium]